MDEPSRHGQLHLRGQRLRDPRRRLPGDTVVSAETPLAGTDVSGTVADAAGNSATSDTVNLKVDTTAPTISFSGNAGSYTVDQTITIACSADDALSGVALDACAGSDLAGVPAASLALGSHTLSGSATDAAGNTGTATATFTVEAAPGGVTALTVEYVRASPRYQALTAQQKATVDALATKATEAIASIVPALSPAQKAEFVAGTRRR